MNVQMDEWLQGCMVGWKDVLVGEFMVKVINGWMNELKVAGINGGIDEWMEELMTNR